MASTINAIGLLIGNPDEIVFVLTKGDVERVYNMMNHLPLGTSPPEAIWSAFKNNMYRLEDRLDHAAAIEDILTDYCQIVPTIAPPPPIRIPVTPAPSPAVDSWDVIQRKKYDTKKFTPPGYGNYVVWSALRVKSFMKALKLTPTVYDTNIRTLAKIHGVHPYDFRWKTNPIVFGRRRGLSDKDMQKMMGSTAFYQMQDRFYNY